MLVLSRKEQQRIHIGDKITVTVVRIGTRVVRIGIDAPKDLAIHRDNIITTEPPPQPE